MIILGWNATRLLQAVSKSKPAKLLFKRAHIDVKCGTCSGFPVCCIAFMSFVWGPSFMRWRTLPAEPPGWWRAP